MQLKQNKKHNKNKQNKIKQTKQNKNGKHNQTIELNWIECDDRGRLTATKQAKK